MPKRENQPEPQLRHDIVDFPLDALGSINAKAARAAQAFSQAPIAMCANSVLATATLAAQHLADVELPTGAVVPTSNFHVSIAITGERKSSCDRTVLTAIRAYEQELLATYEKEKIAYAAAAKAWKNAETQLLRTQTSDPERLKRRLKRLGPAPQKPLRPIVRCKDATFPGLCTLFAVGRSSLGLFTTEAGQFLGGYALRDHAKFHTAGGLCLLWDGEPLSILRKSGDIELTGCRLSTHLMVQPDAAARLIRDPSLAAQGLMSRFLFVVPESEVGKRIWRDPYPGAAKHIKQFDARIAKCLRSATSFAEHEKRPRPILKLTRRAKKQWIRYSDKLERSRAPGGRFYGMDEYVNKSAEHAARIAAVLSVNANRSCKVVNSKYMKRGARLAWYYANQSFKVKDLSAALASTATTLSSPTKMMIAQKLRELGEGDKTIVLSKREKIDSEVIFENAASIRRAGKDNRELLFVKGRVFRDLFGVQHAQVSRSLCDSGLLKPTRKKSAAGNEIKTYTRQERIPGLGKADFYVIDWKMLRRLSSSAGRTEPR